MSWNAAASIGELVGLLLASYGLVRESFADLAQKRPYGEGRYGEGPYGGGVSGIAAALITLAVRVRLLPADGELTITDRERNAAAAISGVFLGALSLLLEIGIALAGRA